MVNSKACLFSPYSIIGFQIQALLAASEGVEGMYFHREQQQAT